MSRKRVQIAPKDKLVTVYIRNVSKKAKEDFVKKAESLGYKPRELFELLVKKI